MTLQRFFWMKLSFTLILAALFLFVLVTNFDAGRTVGQIYRDGVAGDTYIKEGLADTGALNLVAGIYLNYRLYDTIFEVLVFTLAVLGVKLYLSRLKPERPLELEAIPESHLLYTSAALLFPAIALLGVYLTWSGHLGPGGGFGGGVMLGTSLLLLAIARGAEVVSERFHEQGLAAVGEGAVMVLLGLGLLSPMLGRALFSDPLPPGRPGALLSGGWIPLLNLLIGLKVFIGTWIILHYFIEHRGEL